MLYLKSYQGLGNEYLLVDPRRSVLGQSAERLQLALSRSFGVCADGILIGPLPDCADWQLRIFNPDGSEAACGGNAVMIFARYLADAGYVTADSLTVQVGAGQIPVEFLDGAHERVRITLPRASFLSSEVPAAGEVRDCADVTLDLQGQKLRAALLSNGTPHCIVPLENVSRPLACDLGPRIQECGLFPEGVNVTLVAKEEPDAIRVEFFERGVGYLPSSGSCAAAAAAAAHRFGLCGTSVTVRMPGGEMLAELLPDGRTTLTGRVSELRSQTYSDDEVREALCL